MIPRLFLENWNKERGIDKGANPFRYVIKIYEYKSSLSRLICKLRVLLLVKTFLSKIKSSIGLFKY